MAHYTGEYHYRCRLCGAIHVNQIGGWDTDTLSSEMFIVTHGDSPAFDNGNIHKIQPITYHLCKHDNSLGVCDFIGIKKVLQN